MKRPKPHPQSDVELAMVCDWLKANGYSMHVSITGHVELKKLPPRNLTTAKDH